VDEIEPTLEEAKNNLVNAYGDAFVKPVLNKLSFLLTCLSTVKFDKTDVFNFGYGKIWHDGYHYIIDCGFFSVSWFY
jgi:hypothetical protein